MSVDLKCRCRLPTRPLVKAELPDHYKKKKKAVKVCLRCGEKVTVILGDGNTYQSEAAEYMWDYS